MNRIAVDKFIREFSNNNESDRLARADHHTQQGVET